jgi:hypothetical protein
LYYCGTYNIDTSGIITERSGTLRIHVSKYYPTNYFGDVEIFDHNLKCDDSFVFRTRYCKEMLKNRSAVAFCLIF